MNDTGPDAAVEESGFPGFEDFDGVSFRILEEFAEAAADDFLKGAADKIGKAAIDGADFAFKVHSQQDVVEGIDQVAETLLGFGNHGEELLELVVAGKGRVFLIQAADQAFQLSDFLVFIPDVKAEQADEKNQAKRQCFQVKF